MTRIIAGRLGGRRIATPTGSGTRPTSDRVREALFARLETLLDLSGSSVLDLYAGSGALGLEAVSRGASAVHLVDRDRAVVALIRRTVTDLGLADVARVTVSRAERLVGRAADVRHDLVLLDPPYQLGERELAVVLTGLAAHGWLAEDGLVVVERSSRSLSPSWPQGLQTLEVRTYGDTALHLARWVVRLG